MIKLDLPDLFQELWTKYMMPGLIEILGEKPKIELTFYDVISRDRGNKNVMIDNIVAFLQEVFNLAAQKAIVANEELRVIKKENKELLAAAEHNREYVDVGVGLKTAIEWLGRGSK